MFDNQYNNAANPFRRDAPATQPVRVAAAQDTADQAASADQQPPTEPAAQPIKQTNDSQTNWQAIAEGLQAEMDSFRQRQVRQAEAAKSQEQVRLLRQFLPIIDNLERALKQDTPEDQLRAGVELTQREFMRRLAAEGVSKIETVGQLFDPTQHEALAMVAGVADPDTVVQEVEAGYRLGDQLLRPAKVIVAA